MAIGYMDISYIIIGYMDISYIIIGSMDISYMAIGYGYMAIFIDYMDRVRLTF
jgi:hypothetical protein